MFEHLQHVPGIEENDGPQHRREVFGLRQHDADDEPRALVAQEPERAASIVLIGNSASLAIIPPVLAWVL